jgi:peptidyl-prolyl cis-trans isomerase SurA
MKNILFLVFTTLSVSFLSAQTVLTIEGEKIDQSEFLNIYAKNNDNPDLSAAALDEYMELFVNYKLKVLEAKSRGMDTLPSFVKELKGYRKQLAKPYLTDTTFEAEMIEESYQRMTQEVRASHILIKIDNDALPSDTLKAYNKLLAYKKRVEKGESFEKLAKSYSQDPSAKNNQGDLGFFSGMRMVFPFEEAAFNTEIGEMSMPVRTRFGYHLIKVTDKRANPGTVDASHILIGLNPGASAESRKEAKNKISAIFERLTNGESFEELAKKFSEDKNSAKKGGNLGVFGSGKMVESFENQTFALNEGEFSKPFLTDYGFHIVKLNKRIPVQSLAEVKGDIVKRLTSDGRAKQAKISLVNKLKTYYHYEQDDKALASVVKAVNNEIFKGTWKLPKGKWDKIIAKWDENSVTQKDFANYLEKVQRETVRQEKDAYIYRIFNVMINKQIYDYEKGRLEIKYPQFANLMKEYHDGILLFDLTNKEVWKKAVNDSTGLVMFHAAHADDYKWDIRTDVIIAKSENQAQLKLVQKLIKKGVSVSEIDSTLNAENKLNLRIEEKKIEKGQNASVDALKWKAGKFGKYNSDKDYTLVYFKAIEPARNKRLDEVKGIVISDYQSELEKSWIASLRGKYKYEINTKVLHSIK